MAEVGGETGQVTFMKEASLGFGGRQEPGIWGHESRVKAQRGTQRSCGSEHAMCASRALAGRWLKEKAELPWAFLSRGCRWGNWTGFSSPCLSQATQVMLYIIHRRQPSTKDWVRAVCPLMGRLTTLSLCFLLTMDRIPLSFPPG